MLSLNPFYKCIKASKYLQSSLSFDLRLTRHCPQWMLLFNSEHLFKLIICCMWSSRLVFPIQFSLYSCTGEVRSNWAESWNSLSRFTCLPPRTRVSQSVTCFESPLAKKEKMVRRHRQVTGSFQNQVQQVSNSSSREVFTLFSLHWSHI